MLVLATWSVPFLCQVSVREMKPSQAVTAGQHNVTNVKQVNITVSLPFVMTFFEEQFSVVTIQSGGGLRFGGKKPEAETVNHLSVVDLPLPLSASQISYGPTNLDGTRCFSVSWWPLSTQPDHQARLDCLLCQEGRVVVYLVNLPLTPDYLETVLGFTTADLGRKIRTNFSQIFFSPRSDCSLPASCLASPGCPLASSLQQCRRERCLTPGSSPSSTPCSVPTTPTAGMAVYPSSEKKNLGPTLGNFRWISLHTGSSDY